ncbi:MAG: NADP-dependent oxidoreductase [Verrucomicrobia bacterium]|nr:NADP-dependent oxidoreductase [Verrucomicrobiota bacterium]
MKAVVLESFGDAKHLKLKEVETPQPKKGEVRIRIKSSGFNPVDYKIREGHYGGQVPVILGSDCSGIVDALGPDAKGLNIGDEVYAMPFGQCSNGSYAEYLCLPVEFVAKKPNNITLEQASAIPLVAMTAYRAMIASRALKKGDSIFIAGAGGGVGSLAVEMARFSEVKEMFTVAGSEESKQYLHQVMGFRKENILLYKGLTCDQMQEKLAQMNSGRLFDAAFDFVGREMKRLCLKVTGHSGHFASITPESDIFDFPVWERGASMAFGRNMSLHFVFVGSEAFSGPQSSWSVYARQLGHISTLIENGVLRPPSIKIVGNLSAETVAEAHRLLEEGKVKGKLVMNIS